MPKRRYSALFHRPESTANTMLRDFGKANFLSLLHALPFNLLHCNDHLSSLFKNDS